MLLIFRGHVDVAIPLLLISLIKLGPIVLHIELNPSQLDDISFAEFVVKVILS